MPDVVIILGSNVADFDGPIGRVTLVVADLPTQVVTHVVVAPDDVSMTVRLVPIEAVAAVDADLVHLHRTRDQLLAMPEAVSYFSASNSDSPAGVAWWPRELTSSGAESQGGSRGPSYEVIPAGAGALRRDQAVRTSDAQIGRLFGVGVDLSDYRLSRIVVVHTRVFVRRKRWFDIGAILEIADDVRLNLTRQQAGKVARAY
jgi:sporulation protein YlmC with PRC-barrel domain